MFEYISRLSEKSLCIFLFHGVVESFKNPVRNYTRKHISKDYFARLMKELKNSGTPLSMDDVIEIHKSGEDYPDRAFAVTFDDGFENNYSVAAPVLKDMMVPATVYVTSGFVENNAMSWIDKIEYCIEKTRFDSLILPWKKEAVTLEDDKTKIAVLQDIRGNIKKNPEIDVDEFVENIFKQAGMDIVDSTNDPLDLKMNWKQVSQMAADDNFLIGGHTHTHAILSYLDDEKLKEEIDLSFKFIYENTVIKKLRHYSYPEGLDFCYNSHVAQLFMERGIECCPSAVDGVNDKSVDLFDLLRIEVKQAD